MVLFDAANLNLTRAGLLETPALGHAYSQVEQFPTWLPHVTPRLPGDARRHQQVHRGGHHP